MSGTSGADTQAVENADEGEGGSELGAWLYPSDPTDGWEPGPPTLHALLPSAIGGALIPMAVYFLVRPHVSGDAVALAIAGIPAATWVLAEWVRKKTIDPIGSIVLFGFVVGVVVAFSLGGNAFVLKVRDSVFTVLFGVACLVSLVIGRRPVIFFIGRGMSAGDDPVRQGLFNELWELPPARAMFRIVTLLWGVGLIVDATTRVTLAVFLPTDVFVVVAHLVSAVFIGTMFVVTIRITHRTRARLHSTGIVDVPEDGGSTWWWARRFIGRGAMVEG